MNYFKVVLLLLMIVLLSSFKPISSVFICGSEGAKKYHFNKNCRGLKSCEHTIYEVSLNKAQQLGLSLCGWED